MELKGMDTGLWRSTLWFGLAGVLLYLPLFWLLPAQTFRDSRRAVVMGASLFWLAFTAILVNLAWGYYFFFEYQVYWAIALWLGWILLELSNLRKETPS